MSATIATLDAAAGFEARRADLTPGPQWLETLRHNAWRRFAELGFPSHRHEKWRHTNVARIAQAHFGAGAPAAPDDFKRRLQARALPGVDWDRTAHRLIFFNGRFVAADSSSGELPASCRLESLAAMLADPERQSRLEPFLGRFADFEEQAFVALNTALIDDGAYVEIGRNAVVADPIELLFVSAGGAGAPAATFPRTLVTVEEGGNASIVATYVSLDESPSLTVPVTEILIAANAEIDATHLEQESRHGFHVSHLQSRQARNSRFTAHAVSLGGELVRNGVHAVLDGEGSECLLTGLSALDGRQHVDNATVLDHAQPLGRSREYYKGILDGEATSVFTGRIIVRPGAQHTDAIQSNKNLVLSNGAATHSQPELEIYADDVRCTHGATVGQLDDEAYFYLRSRGIGARDARNLLTYAFAADVLGRMRQERIRRRLEALLFQRWSGVAAGADVLA